ncbi:MAG TPA: hypothetical protein VHE34_04225 [Puia sp.]|nr:hypothetical protein [Puia sp.]HVU94402.1 hypothetical protein [Puia sp.]
MIETNPPTRAAADTTNPLATVSIQAVRAALVNPIKSLRGE